MSTKNLQPRTPGAPSPTPDSTESAVGAGAADPTLLDESNGADGADSAEDAAALAAENKKLKAQLQSERAKNTRDRSKSDDHLPDQASVLGIDGDRKPIARAVLTKDGWIPADPPKVAGR